MDWNFKFAQLNTYITAAAVISAFSLAIFVEFDEQHVEGTLKVLYYIVTSISFIFSLATVIVAVGISRLMGAPDISNETSQDVMGLLIKNEKPIIITGLICFNIGTIAFVLQFVLLAFAKIKVEPLRWIVLGTAILLVVVDILFQLYIIGRVRYYSSLAKRNKESLLHVGDESRGIFSQ